MMSSWGFLNVPYRDSIVALESETFYRNSVDHLEADFFPLQELLAAQRSVNDYQSPLLAIFSSSASRSSRDRPHIPKACPILTSRGTRVCGRCEETLR